MKTGRKYFFHNAYWTKIFFTQCILVVVADDDDDVGHDDDDDDDVGHDDDDVGHVVVANHKILCIDSIKNQCNFCLFVCLFNWWATRRPSRGQPVTTASPRGALIGDCVALA
jgi:hypothetical protein